MPDEAQDLVGSGGDGFKMVGPFQVIGHENTKISMAFHDQDL